MRCPIVNFPEHKSLLGAYGSWESRRLHGGYVAHKQSKAKVFCHSLRRYGYSHGITPLRKDMKKKGVFSTNVIKLRIKKALPLGELSPHGDGEGLP